MATVQDINNRENIDPDFVVSSDRNIDPSFGVSSDRNIDPGFTNALEIRDTFNPDNLNSEALTPQPDTSDFETLTESPPPDISGLDPTPVAPLGDTQQEASDLSTELQGLYDQTLGKSAFTAEQEDIQGVTGIESNITDLSAQLQGLINESKAIPLQLQQESIGRGRTAGGIAPLQASRLRKNAIQALTVNSLLESSRGNLSTALSLVDRAVRQKFDPIYEKIAVKTKNLELIINSEAYTQEERAQAQAQMDIQNNIENKAREAEAEQTAIWNLGVEAAKSGLVDSVTLNAIQNAKTKEGALQLMVDAGVYSEKVRTEFEQQAFENKIELEQLQLDRDKYATDVEFRNANLDLDVAKAQASIDKIYNDITRSGEITVSEQLQLQKLEQDKITAQAKVDKAKIKAGKQADTLDSKIDLIDSLLGTGENATAKEKKDAEEAIENLVGTTGLGRTAILSKYTVKNRALVGGIGQLVSQETLDTLIELKSSGATLGAISEKELDILQSAATQINKWEVKDKETGLGVGRWNAGEEQFKAELQKIKDATIRLRDAARADAEAGQGLGNQTSFTNINDFLLKSSTIQQESADNLKAEFPDLSDDDLIDLINEQSSFNTVGSDTNTATLNEVAKDDVGDKKGQCGRYVNNVTGLGVGDSFNSKMAKMDKSIKEPAPGMVFTMPYKNTGHCGIILSVKDGVALVKDSNWSKDEKIKIHKIPVNKMTGFAIA